MPTKFLSKLQSLLQRNQSNSNDDDISSAHLNFIPSSQTADVKIIESFTDRHLYIMWLWIISIGFLILLIANFYVQNKLNDLKEEIDASYTKVRSISHEEEYLTELEKNIRRYKTLAPEKSELNEKVKNVTYIGNLNIDIQQYSVNDEYFTLLAVGEGPRAFAGLIGLYLEQDQISTISIDSAVINPYDSTMTVSLKGNFK